MHTRLSFRHPRELFFVMGLVIALLMPFAAIAQSSASGSCGAAGGRPLQPCPTDIKLLQPLDDSTTTIQRNGVSSGPYGALSEYFFISFPFLVATAVGVTVLQGVIGGIQILFSAGGGGYEQGKTRLLWSIAGFVLLMISGFILRTLNPLFFI